jgi:hypothetical protein
MVVIKAIIIYFVMAKAIYHKGYHPLEGLPFQ